MMLLGMNDRGYGVIRNIQDARFGGRKYYVDLHTPQFADLARSLGWRHTRLDDVGKAGAVLARAVAETGPRMVEVAMVTNGPYASALARQPVPPGSWLGAHTHRLAGV